MLLASSINIAAAAAPPTSLLLSKRGYLFKWADRSIGWGGTKWALRFVVLEGGKISYFGHHSDVSPRYVLTLRGCAVRDEGLKPNKRYKKKQNDDSHHHSMSRVRTFTSFPFINVPTPMMTMTSKIVGMKPIHHRQMKLFHFFASRHPHLPKRHSGLNSFPKRASIVIQTSLSRRKWQRRLKPNDANDKSLK